MKASDLFYIGLIIGFVPYILMSIAEYDPEVEFDWSGIDYSLILVVIGGVIAGRLTTKLLDDRYIVVKRKDTIDKYT